MIIIISVVDSDFPAAGPETLVDIVVVISPSLSAVVLASLVVVCSVVVVSSTSVVVAVLGVGSVIGRGVEADSEVGVGITEKVLMKVGKLSKDEVAI